MNLQDFNTSNQQKILRYGRRALLLQALVERAKLAAASPHGGKHARRAAVRISLCHNLAVGHCLLLQPVQQSCVPHLLVSALRDRAQTGYGCSKHSPTFFNLA